MDMTSEKVLAAMRCAAWERAKGELHSMGHTMYGKDEQFRELDKEITDFIAEVEDRGLHE